MSVKRGLDGCGGNTVSFFCSLFICGTASPQRTGRPIPKNAPRAFHLLAKPSGATCNLDCAYCFFLDKDLLLTGSQFRLRDEMLDQYIRHLIESHRLAVERVEVLLEDDQVFFVDL